MLSTLIGERTGLDDRTLKQRRRAPYIALFDAEGSFIAAQTTAHEFAPIVTNQESSEDAPRLRELVRSTAVRWAAQRRANDERSLLKPGLLVTLVPLAGNGATFVGVMLERFATREALARSIGEFGITRREAEVLRLMLEGLSSAGVAERLHISQATVQGHVKHLLVKTESKNRAQMIARVLGWQGNG
jgi:DNA-binding CsgD family transcriptional regulator